MSSFIRRVSKSKVGTVIMAGVFIATLAGLVLTGESKFGTGSLGFGLDSSTLAKIGKQKITEREMREAMQRRLQQARQEKPDADYPSLAQDFDPLLGQMIDQRAIIAFARKYGFNVSKRLIDAEISDLPGVRGLNGKPSVQGYQAFLGQNRLTDQQVREQLSAEIVARYLLLPVTAGTRVPVGMATPYASMLLEQREGEAAVLPITAFTTGLKPTDTDLQRYYAANRARYMVSEQRVLRMAKIGPEQVAGVAASDQEIGAYYKANQATYASKETRTLTQAVVPDQRAATEIAARARGGASIAAAAAPAGANAAVTSLNGQTRDAYSSVAGAKVAAAAFGAATGAIIGPVQSDFGWIVVKIDAAKTEGGKSLAAARAEIAAKLNADKRKQAIEDLVDKIQDALDGGANFTEATAQAKLPVITTPLVMANGASRAQPGAAVPPALLPALKAGFEIAPNDPPEIPALADKSGYVVVSASQVVPAAPAPFASIRDRIANDWIASQAIVRAKAAATAIAAKASRGLSLTEAVKQSGINLPVRPLVARRLQIAQANPEAIPALRALFSMTAGKSQMAPDSQGRGFFVVKTNKITPGNALMAMGVIAQMRNELQQTMSDDYARQFVTAIREDIKVRRNEDAIKAVKQQIFASAN
jgi:peptidyl-prolyl cis-trans isomerase D